MTAMDSVQVMHDKEDKRNKPGVENLVRPWLYRFDYELKGSDTRFTSNIVGTSQDQAQAYLIDLVKRAYKQYPHIVYMTSVSRIDEVLPDARAYFGITAMPPKQEPVGSGEKSENKKYGWDKKK